MRQRLLHLLTTGALAWERVARPRVRGGAMRHVLVLHFPSSVGLAMAETPLFEALKQLEPAPRVTVATSGVGLEILRGSPYVDRLLVVPHPASGLRAAARALRGRVDDVDGVLLAAFDRQRAIVRLAWLVAGVWRAGFAEEERTVQRPLRYDAAVSVVGNNLRVAGLLGWAGSLLRPTIFFGPREAEQARAWLNPEGRPTLLVVSHTSAQASQWVPERMAEVLRYAQDEMGYAVVLDGGPDQVGQVERLRGMVGGGCVSLAGRTGLRQFAAVAAASDVVLSVETGPMHLAEAVGVPMVVLSPEWVEVETWHPLPNERVCLLHGERVGPVEDGYRMEELSVERVKGALEAMAREFPASGEAREERLRRWCTERDLLG